MAIQHGYCTEAQLRQHLGDDGTALDQSVLERAIGAASRSIDGYCGRRFWQDPTVTTRTYAPEDWRDVYVDDISSRTGLVVSVGTNGITYPTALVAGTDFILEPRNADLSGDAYAFWRISLIGNTTYTMVAGVPTLQVTAQFGWSAVPDVVEQACLIKAAALFKRKDAPFGVAGFGEFGAVRISRADPDVMDLLGPLVVRAMVA